MGKPDAALEADRYYLVRRDWFDARDQTQKASFTKVLEGGRIADPYDKQKILVRFPGERREM